MKFPFRKNHQLTKEETVDLMIYGIMGLMGWPVKLVEKQYGDIFNNKKPKNIFWDSLVKTITFMGKQKIKIDDNFKSKESY